MGVSIIKHVSKRATPKGTTMNITTKIGQYADEAGDYQIIEKRTDEGQLVSALYADLKTGQIMNIETEEEFQGEGHARSLIEYAVAHRINVLHSPEWSCTEEGAAFAAATSDLIDTIDDEDAYGYEDFAATLAC